MEQQQATTPPPRNGSDFSKRLFFRSEALHLIGEITGLLAKVDADVQAATSHSGHVGHGSDDRVFGGTLKGVYNPFRGRAITLKRLIVEQLGVADSQELDEAFQEYSLEDYGGNRTRALEAIEKLTELAQQIDPTPPIILPFANYGQQ